MRWLAVLALLPLTAHAADADKRRERLERRAEKRAEETAAAEARWVSACQMADGAPEDPRAVRCRARAETSLVNLRARWIGVKKQLDALGSPEAEVRVLFATNREGWRRHGEWYRARDADRVEYGVATVRIPQDHPAGELERGLEVLRVDVLTEDTFRAELGRALENVGPDGRVLAYVHGYNNSFEYATRRAAQVAHDLDAGVVPVLFSWPSQGGTWFASVKYTYDENAAARSSLPLADALHDVLVATEAPVTLMAHSMGSRVVSDALVDLELEGRLVRPLDQLVFAAPDVDASVFARRYLSLAMDASARITVYCASDDRALKLSRGVHGGYDRLGSCREDSLALLRGQGVEVVDASRLYVNLLDHDKVASSPRLIADLRRVLDGVPASHPSRGLVDRETRFELPP